MKTIRILADDAGMPLIRVPEPGERYCMLCGDDGRRDGRGADRGLEGDPR